MADRYIVKKNSAGGLGFVVVDTTTNKDVAWVFDQARNPDLDESRAKLFADALNNGDKIAAIRQALDSCNAQPPCYIVDAIYDFKQAVEEILGGE